MKVRITIRLDYGSDRYVAFTCIGNGHADAIVTSTGVSEQEAFSNLCNALKLVQTKVDVAIGYGDGKIYSSNLHPDSIYDVKDSRFRLGNLGWSRG